MVEKTANTVIFFDGYCGLCNRFVDLTIRRNKRQKLLFAPLQGETAANRLTSDQREKYDSIVLLMDGELYYRSAAAVRIMMKMDGLWPILGAIAWLCPWFIRNWLYDIVARNRNKWFDRLETCRLPTPEEKMHFLS